EAHYGDTGPRGAAETTAAEENRAVIGAREARGARGCLRECPLPAAPDCRHREHRLAAAKVEGRNAFARVVVVVAEDIERRAVERDAVAAQAVSEIACCIVQIERCSGV